MVDGEVCQDLGCVIQAPEPGSQVRIPKFYIRCLISPIRVPIDQHQLSTINDRQFLLGGRAALRENGVEM